MAGIISKGITLSYTTVEEFTSTDWVDLTNLQEIPDLGTTTETIEVTTLADEAHMYTDGLKNYGDSLDFKFLYEPGQYQDLNPGGGIIMPVKWKVSLPGGCECIFSGKHTVKLDGVGVNAVLTYTLSIRPTSEMQWQ